MADRRPASNRGTSPRRPATRPAQRGVPDRGAGRARATASPGPGGRPPPRSRLTGRAAILILLIAVLTVSYASSMRAYLEQRSHIAALKVEIADRSADIAALETEKDRWRDDAFLEQQARERFGFVYPGETSYQVLDLDGKPLDDQAALPDAGRVITKAPTAWWDTAWASVEIAGNPDKVASGPPAP